METLSSSSTTIPFPREPVDFEDISMHQKLLFSDSLKDLKNLSKQLYSAAEYFELSYTNDDQKQIVVDTLKDYAIKAVVNTVDHLGAVSYKVNNLIDENVEEVSGTEIRVSCIEQRLRTCQGYFDHEGISQQSLLMNIPKYHKRYILPVKETKQEGTRTESNHQKCLLYNDGWHEQKIEVDQATISEKPKTLVRNESSPSPSPQATQLPESSPLTDRVPRKKKRPLSPRRFPLLDSGCISSRFTTPNSRINSRSSTPNPSRPTSPTLRQQHQEPRKSVSKQRNGDRNMYTETEQITSKSKRILKALLSRRKSKKDDMLYTYLDEY
ncbi:protein ABIL3-like isoform X2 [Rutidosis leptorrhynchoides]|uniref:protein ABIL3-like isoform X2 n=1 Tax=Rutidosis leptorrhynchoides TaxID=125765 RepID=UPI003A998FAE